ncbi:MAG: ABC transporter ATP-binding protein [Treponema sp.]|nr:ABC transporter ATP-binding protein [Treponema sp.]
MTEPILQIKNVSRKFSNVVALKGISLEVFRGEFIVVCGRNGSGKSVLMSLIAQLDEPTCGQISVPKSGVGLVFQDADAQILGETPVEDVSFGLKNQKIQKKEIKKKVEETLKSVGLYERRFAPARQMSGGEKRRLAVAGILAMNREIFIFDEPFANLDFPGVQSVCEILKKLKAAQKTIIVLTHELEKILGLADRFVILDKGEIKFSGTPEEGLKLDLNKFGIKNPLERPNSISELFWGNK